MRTHPVWRFVVACAAGAALAGCVQAPGMVESQQAPRDVIDLRLGYPEAFDRVVKALEREGYEIEAADERVGLIRTAPKEREGSGGVAYKTAVIVRMGGTDRESWLAVDHVAIPTFPEEERKIEDALKGIAK
jgi:hypothetical protein